MLGVSHFLKPPRRLLPPPLFISMVLLLLMSNKGRQSKNNGMFLALKECHTSEDIYPREPQVCKRSTRQKVVRYHCYIAEIEMG